MFNLKIWGFENLKVKSRQIVLDKETADCKSGAYYLHQMLVWRMVLAPSEFVDENAIKSEICRTFAVSWKMAL